MLSQQPVLLGKRIYFRLDLHHLSKHLGLRIVFPCFCIELYICNLIVENILFQIQVIKVFFVNGKQTADGLFRKTTASRHFLLGCCKNIICRTKVANRVFKACKARYNTTCCSAKITPFSNQAIKNNCEVFSANTHCIKTTDEISFEFLDSLWRHCFKQCVKCTFDVLNKLVLRNISRFKHILPICYFRKRSFNIIASVKQRRNDTALHIVLYALCRFKTKGTKIYASNHILGNILHRFAQRIIQRIRLSPCVNNTIELFPCCPHLVLNAVNLLIHCFAQNSFCLFLICNNNIVPCACRGSSLNLILNTMFVEHFDILIELIIKPHDFVWVCRCGIDLKIIATSSFFLH